MQRKLHKTAQIVVFNCTFSLYNCTGAAPRFWRWGTISLAEQAKKFFGLLCLPGAGGH